MEVEPARLGGFWWWVGFLSPVDLLRLDRHGGAVGDANVLAAGFGGELDGLGGVFAWGGVADGGAVGAWGDLGDVAVDVHARVSVAAVIWARWGIKAGRSVMRRRR